MCETEQIVETPYENTLCSWRRTLRPPSQYNLLLLHANPNSQNKSPLCCCEPLYWHCICQQSVFFPHCRLILARRLMKTQVQVLLKNDTHRISTYFLHFVTSFFCQQIYTFSFYTYWVAPTLLLTSYLNQPLTAGFHMFALLPASTFSEPREGHTAHAYRCPLLRLARLLQSSVPASPKWESSRDAIGKSRELNVQSDNIIVV